MHVLIVDGANVVGSRPTGWWRDRAGAARTLHAQLAAARDRLTADDGFDAIMLVLEGRARGGHAAGTDGAIDTVHAAGSGDDEMVRRAAQLTADGHHVTVVTADRGLRSRITDTGGESLAPSWLLARFDAA